MYICFSENLVSDSSNALTGESVLVCKYQIQLVSKEQNGDFSVEAADERNPKSEQIIHRDGACHVIN